MSLLTRNSNGVWIKKSQEPEQPNAMWHIVPDETHNAAVTFAFTNVDADLKLKVTTKWDGCTHLCINEVAEVDGDEEECYHHICDLDEFIAALQAVRDKARSYFHGEFGVATVSDEERWQKIAAFQKEG